VKGGVLLFLFLGVGTAAAVGKEGVARQIVDAADLARNPEHYWLQPIVFRDELQSYPGRRKVNIGGHAYYIFRTRTAGMCAAGTNAVERIRTLAVGREYLFKGTVLARGRDFYIVVNDAGPATDVEQAAEAVRSGIQEPVADTALEELIGRVEAALVALAEKHGTTLAGLLRADSQYRGLVLDTIQSTLIRESRLSGVTAEMLLSRLILDALSRTVPPSGDGAISRGSRALRPGGGSAGAVAGERPKLKLRTGIIRFRPRHAAPGAASDRVGGGTGTETEAPLVPP